MTTKFSVWALAPLDHPGLQVALQELHQRYGGPVLQPHVTVLGVVELTLEDASSRLQALARTLTPITYRIRGVSCGETYYQCVYLVIEPTKQVLDSNRQAKRIFGLAESESAASVGYMPHLSLLYGELTDANKEKAKETLESGYGHVLFDTEFQVSSLSLYSTDTEDKLLLTWKKSAEYFLEGP